MLYYAIQVKTTKEADFVHRLEQRMADSDDPPSRFFIPKRLMAIRRSGMQKPVNKLYPVFPGYVFMETEELTGHERWLVRHTEGYYRFLKSSYDPTPLTDVDKRLLLHFISFGEYADISKVSFDENDRIVVLEGPMKGLEGSIVKVDRRRGRAKIALDLFKNGFLVDFSFEVVEKAKAKEENPNGGET
jgi:transcriptional antiterminator NusG